MQSTREFRHAVDGTYMSKLADSNITGNLSGKGGA